MLQQSSARKQTPHHACLHDNCSASVTEASPSSAELRARGRLAEATKEKRLSGSLQLSVTTDRLSNLTQTQHTPFPLFAISTQTVSFLPQAGCRTKFPSAAMMMFQTPIFLRPHEPCPPPPGQSKIKPKYCKAVI